MNTESEQDAAREGGILECFSVSMGSMGLSLSDFCAMTPHEFNGVLRSWHRTHVEQPWDQTRLLACAMLQPWSKKKLRPEDIMRFSWDEKKTASARPAHDEQSTRQRFEEIRRRCGG